MKSKKLYEHLFILRKCYTNIESAGNFLHKIQDKLYEEDSISGLLFNYINLEAVSFMDEFEDNRKYTEKEYHERIMHVRKITAPVTRRIRKWSHLKNFRHHFVAHPWRDHKGYFIIPDNRNFIVPRNGLEYIILKNLISYVHQVLRKEFMKEYAEMLVYMNTLEFDGREPTNYSNLNEDHTAMLNEVNSYCAELKKPYHLQIELYDLPDQKISKHHS